MQLTEKETKMLVAFIAEGVSTNGAKSMQGVLEDNMTWMSATDLCTDLKMSKQAIGGIMGSLSEKGLIADSGESAREARDNDWYATDEGIKIGWKLYEESK